MKDGSVLSIYSHWDNSPEYNGRILRTHYNTREKVEELVDGGDVSSLWTDERWNCTHKTNYGPNYYSYRGEDCPPRLDKDILEYLHPVNSEEYAYLFRNGEWVCYNMNKFDDSKRPEIVDIPEGALAV